MDERINQLAVERILNSLATFKLNIDIDIDADANY